MQGTFEFKDIYFYLALISSLLVGYYLIILVRGQIRGIHQAFQNVNDSLNKELSKLNQRVDDLTFLVEKVALSSSEREEIHFKRLPTLTWHRIASLESGDSINLLLKEVTETGSIILFNVIYIHKLINYLRDDKKYSIAYGQARLDSSDEFRDVRIILSTTLNSATLRGLSMVGEVKEGTLPN